MEGVRMLTEPRKIKLQRKEILGSDGFPNTRDYYGSQDHNSKEMNSVVRRCSCGAQISIEGNLANTDRLLKLWDQEHSGPGHQSCSAAQASPQPKTGASPQPPGPSLGQAKAGANLSYQKCPICNGSGSVSGGFFGHPGDLPTWVPDHTIETCRRCKGTGTIETPKDSAEGFNAVIVGRIKRPDLTIGDE